MPLDHEPLTVIEVDHAINQEEAQRIRDAFRASVPDERPVLVLGPNSRAFELENYAVAYARSIAALIIAVIAILTSATLLIIVVLQS